MAYECKTCQEIIHGETFYFLWTGKGYRIYHWNGEFRELRLIHPNFFININCARAHATDYAKNTSKLWRIRHEMAVLQALLDEAGNEGGM